MGDTRAFVSDFDGTLYHYDRDGTSGVSAADARAIRSFQAAGGLFGVSSFRPPRAITLQSGDAITFDFFVSVDGALVIDGSGSVIDAHRMPYDVVAQLHGVYAPVATAVIIAAERDLYAIGRHGHHFVRDVASLADLPTELYGVSIATGSVSSAVAVAREVNDAMGDVVTATVNVTGVDVVVSGCTKATAIDVARRTLGADVVAAMGDAENDLGLFDAADVSYAPPSSSQPVLAAATATAANVAEALADFADRVDDDGRRPSV